MFKSKIELFLTTSRFTFGISFEGEAVGFGGLYYSRAMSTGVLLAYRNAENHAADHYDFLS